MPDTHMIPWTAGTWTRRPITIAEHDGALVAAAAEGSDAWRHTAYGFVHADEHALLAPLGVGEAMEVTFRAPWSGQFDQAGILLRADAENWVKAGIEFADGHLGVGAVVTRGSSDWSLGRADDWMGSDITVRLSRWPDAVIVRARAEHAEWRLVRVAPFDGAAPASAGPLLAAPTRAGLTVTFTRWVRTAADAALH
ncbi:DUF1349 domain-containing protein [Microbacterium sp. 179-I 3D4 NHS]|uniref:DUF1349 domain-containing protein n=1 Tax=Microbacterium sp. 179-I 3D4 NHS TaxID=3142381 RepID=UPI0039A16366